MERVQPVTLPPSGRRAAVSQEGAEAALAPAGGSSPASEACPYPTYRDTVAAWEEAQLAWEQSRSVWDETQAARGSQRMGLGDRELSLVAEILARAARDIAQVVVARATRLEHEAEQFRDQAATARRHSERALVNADAVLARCTIAQLPRVRKEKSGEHVT